MSGKFESASPMHVVIRECVGYGQLTSSSLVLADLKQRKRNNRNRQWYVRGMDYVT